MGEFRWSNLLISQRSFPVRLLEVDNPPWSKLALSNPGVLMAVNRRRITHSRRDHHGMKRYPEGWPAEPPDYWSAIDE